MWRRAIGVCRYLRAPKKEKKSGDKVQVVSQDLINIFVDKKDPELKPLDQYPEWLYEMLLNHDTGRGDTWAIKAAQGDRSPIDPIRLRHFAKYDRRLKLRMQKDLPLKAFFNPKYDEVTYDWDLDEANDVEDDMDNHLDPLYKLAAGSNWEIERERERLRLLGLLQMDLPEDEEEAEAAEAKTPEKKEEDRRAQMEKQKKADKEADEEVARMMKKGR